MMWTDFDVRGRCCWPGCTRRTDHRHIRAGNGTRSRGCAPRTRNPLRTTSSTGWCTWSCGTLCSSDIQHFL